MERRVFWRGLLIGSLLSAAAALAVAIRRRRTRPSPVMESARRMREGAGRLVEWSRGAARRLARVRED
jgi:hypothetical protein